MPVKRLFVSYSRQDQEHLGAFVNQLAARPESAEPRLNWWCDVDPTYGIRPSEDWAEGLEEKIRTCDLFCILLSSRWGASQNCQQELSWARQHSKAIVQIRVSPVTLPLPRLSQLPNSRAWIAEESERERRDTHWLAVVNGLIGPAESQWRETQGNRSDLTAYRDMLDELHTFKVFHDLAHDLLENHVKSLLVDLKANVLSQRDLPNLRAHLNNARATLEGLRQAKEQQLTAVDQQQIENLREALKAAIEPVNLYLANNASPALSTRLQNDLVTLGSELSLSLHHFNGRMVENVDRFDVEDFVESLNRIMQQQRKYLAELPYWKETGAAAKLWLCEHNQLQVVLDELLRFEPEEFELAPKVAKFVRAWPDIDDPMTLLLDKWAKEREPENRRSALAARPSVAAKYEELKRVVQSVPVSGPAPTEVVNQLQNRYGEFFRDFGSYFLAFDKEFKGTTAKITLSLAKFAA